MTKTTIFENIGWGKFANAKITIEEFYTPSNDPCFGDGDKVNAWAKIPKYVEE